MQRLYSECVGLPIMSVQTSQMVGQFSKNTLSPDDLKITLIGVKVAMGAVQYLLPDDVRLFDTTKIVIDSEQKLSDSEDLVRFDKMQKRNYELISKPVITLSGKKLGKVRDYTFDTTHFLVAKLCITPGLLQRFVHSSLLIDRNDIIETKADVIVVKESTIKVKKTASQVLPAKS